MNSFIAPFTLRRPPAHITAPVLILLFGVIIALPPYFYRALIVLSPPVIGFVMVGLWLDDGALADDSELFSAIGYLAFSVTTGILFVHLALLLFGSGLFAFRGILTTLSGVLLAVSLPVYLGGGAAYWLVPGRWSLVAGLLGIGVGLALILTQALIDIDLLTWGLFLLSPLVTSASIIQRYRQNTGDHQAELLRGGLIAGAISGLVACVAISITVRVVLCLGAVDCAEQFGLAGWLLFYGVVVAMFALNLLVNWLVGSLTLFIYARL